MSFTRPNLVRTLMSNGNDLGSLDIERIAFHQNEAVGRTSGKDYWTAADLRNEWQRQHEIYQAVGAIARILNEPRLVVKVAGEVVDE